MQTDISVLPNAGCLLKQPKQILYSKCANWETLQHHRPTFALGNNSKYWYFWDHSLRTAPFSHLPSCHGLKNSRDCYNICIAEECFPAAEMLLSPVALSAIMGTYLHSMFEEQTNAGTTRAVAPVFALQSLLSAMKWQQQWRNVKEIQFKQSVKLSFN